MHLTVISQLENELKNPAARNEFMDAVEIRQRLFRKNHQKACILDAYDMFSHHLILRSGVDGQPMAYLRVTTWEDCKKHDMPYPIENLCKGRLDLTRGLKDFLNTCPQAIHSGYLCLDETYRQEMGSIKPIDLMGFFGFVVTGFPADQLGISATLNVKYKQDHWMQKMGDVLPGIEDFEHPLIPESHRLILIPRLREEYWVTQLKTYAELYRSFNLGRSPEKAAA